ncbi:MAG: guanylate kinase [Capnocytophaga sp.]|nr:guanylate kinase [Capnocytophaga sp.]
MNKLIIFSAPSGSGKTTIVKHLLSLSGLNLAFSISATSRPPRGAEQHGKEYYFLTTEEFQQKIKNNEFLEWEEVYPGTYYGTLKSEIERLWKEGKNVAFDIDVVGGLAIKKQYPQQSLSIFVKPPSIDELRRRLQGRQTETPEKIKMRIDKAEAELKYADRFDITIENEDLPKALYEAEVIVNQYIKS